MRARGRCGVGRGRALVLVGLGACSAPGAWAQMAPFAVGATLAMEHQDNLFRASPGAEVGDWRTTATVQGSFDQEIGRQRVKATAELSANRYRNTDRLNNEGYQLEAQWLWSTVGLWSGVLGADLSSRLYDYGLEGETPTDRRNLERTERAYLRASVGGVTTLTFDGSLDVLKRSYSLASFAPNELEQATASAGVSYRPNPDLRLGLTASYTDGSQPDYTPAEADEFTRADVRLRMQWQVTGASGVDVDLGYSADRHTLQSDRSFVNGGVRWNWKPTGRLNVSTGLRRDGSNSALAFQDTDARIVGTSLITALDLTADWEVTAKIKASGRLVRETRRFSSDVVGVGSSGSNRVWSAQLGLDYAITRNLSLGCDVSQQQLRTEGTAGASRPFDLTTVGCSAQFWLR